jgi:hypothetical protein
MTEPELVRVFVNGIGVSLPRGATVIDAVRAHDAAAADALILGSRAATDSRGLPVALDARCSGGMVLRLVSARALANSGEES